MIIFSSLLEYLLVRHQWNYLPKFLPNILLASPNPSHSSNLKSNSSYLRGVRLNSLKVFYNKDLSILPTINLGDQTFIHTHTQEHAHVYITEELKEMSFDMDHAD